MVVLEAPRFYPTLEEFVDFSGYVEKIEEEVDDFGLCVVVPPKGWAPRKREKYDDLDEVTVQKPIRQEFTGSKGVYYCLLLESRSLPVKKFKTSAEQFAKRFGPENNIRGLNGKDVSEEEMERYYWRNIRFRRPVYGADVTGSLFDEDVKEWNPGHLGTELDLVGGMPGVTVPYLYFGMYGATFAWHTEDMDLYSINYIHFGKPKTWYFLPQSEKTRFETLCRKLYASHFDDCKEFMRHKLAMLAPEVLMRNGLTYGKTTHCEGEFVIVFPGVYHSGFNHGFNCAESVNFASERWLPWGRKAGHCHCRNDAVSIDCDILAGLIEADKKKKEAEAAASVIEAHNEAINADQKQRDDEAHAGGNLQHGGSNELRKIDVVQKAHRNPHSGAAVDFNTEKLPQQLQPQRQEVVVNNGPSDLVEGTAQWERDESRIEAREGSISCAKDEGTCKKTEASQGAKPVSSTAIERVQTTEGPRLVMDEKLYSESEPSERLASWVRGQATTRCEPAVSNNDSAVQPKCRGEQQMLMLDPKQGEETAGISKLKEIGAKQTLWTESVERRQRVAQETVGRDASSSVGTVQSSVTPCLTNLMAKRSHGAQEARIHAPSQPPVGAQSSRVEEVVKKQEIVDSLPGNEADRDLRGSFQPVFPKLYINPGPSVLPSTDIHFPAWRQGALVTAVKAPCVEVVSPPASAVRNPAKQARSLVEPATPPCVDVVKSLVSGSCDHSELTEREIGSATSCDRKRKFGEDEQTPATVLPSTLPSTTGA